MNNADEFDDLYKEVRDRLLAEAYALTGDQHVSRTAVRDALTAAWHHWGKVRRLQDKEAWLRPLVWKRARHRHTARPWHREKDLPIEVAATLEVLGTLPSTQRKALVLANLPGLPMADIAREIGAPVEEAEQQLRAGTLAFTLGRDTPTISARAHLERLGQVVAGGRWPRSTILRRAGTARRRTHTAVGVAATVAAVVVSGMVVAQGETVDATLSDQGFERKATRVEAAPELPVLEDSVLLEADQVRRVDRGLEWTETNTLDNAAGDAPLAPCQTVSFADPEGLGAYVRTFEGQSAPPERDRRKGRAAPPSRSAVAMESVELSRTPEDADAAFDAALGWFSGCATERTQLMAYHQVRGVGDRAGLVTLRSWDGPTRTVQVGLARSGQLLTTTVTRVDGLKTGTEAAAALLAASVNAKCASPGSGTCASPPRVRRTAVPRAGVVPGMLSEFDLPPVTKAPGPWFGVPPERARANDASTRCDRTEFRGNGLKHNLTRTFLFPQRGPMGEFGLTQTVAMASNPKAARRFVEEVRSRVGRCADERFGTDVTRLVDQATEKVDLTVWQLELDLSDDRSLSFLMAIMRHGDTVSQVGFTPARGLTMSRDDFSWLARRALERLPRLQLESP